MTSDERGADLLSVRGRLLAAADEPFDAEGVHGIGIDRVIELAGVAKASLYRTFGSEEELVAAYLAARHEAIRQQILQAVERETEPRARLPAVFAAERRTGAVRSPGTAPSPPPAKGSITKPPATAARSIAGLTDELELIRPVVGGYDIGGRAAQTMSSRRRPQIVSASPSTCSGKNSTRCSLARGPIDWTTVAANADTPRAAGSPPATDGPQLTSGCHMSARA